MATIQIPARRLLIAGGFAVAVAAAPAVASLTFAPAAGPSVIACANGESTDIYNGVCTPDLVPNSPEPGAVDGLPSIDGIPCTGGNSGQCIGLAEEQEAQGPAAVPRSSLNGQPLG